MNGPLDIYGLDENIGLHVIISNLLWWMSVFLIIIAYRYRNMWNVGNIPWPYLFFGFLFFGIREAGHFSASPVIGSLRYIFGIWSAIFLTFAFYFIYLVICKRKKISRAFSYMPVALGLFFPVLMIYYYISQNSLSEIKDIMNTLEAIVWMLGSSVTIYTTFMLGTRVSGGFIKVFMFFQFSAYAAFTWKFLGLLESISWPVPYSIREVVETLFGVFAIISVYMLAGMLRKLYRDIHGNKS
ncbi:MAG: hypothetical protein Q8M95_10720 [Candidatus Methanoperedens sp.]|nr:hypothetical protein [Candidatus Methanoperedens sp.]